VSRQLGALVVVLGLAAAGCQTVRVQVPPEADLAGIKTVAVISTDLPGDSAPVAILLRGEASSRIRRLLPSLTLVDPIAGPDAILRMAVVRHGTTAPSVRVYVDRRTRRVHCEAWQSGTLLVDASVVTGPTIRWQGILEAQRTIELRCLGVGGVLIPETPRGDFDHLLVRDAVDDLGRRLAGYARTELRRLQDPPLPPSEVSPDRP
jgi:hypothetical protein